MLTKQKAAYLRQFTDLKQRAIAAHEYDRKILQAQRQSYEKIEQDWLISKGLVPADTYDKKVK